jgi:hypothetical protein
MKPAMLFECRDQGDPLRGCFQTHLPQAFDKEFFSHIYN